MTMLPPGHTALAGHWSQLVASGFQLYQPSSQGTHCCEMSTSPTTQLLMWKVAMDVFRWLGDSAVNATYTSAPGGPSSVRAVKMASAWSPLDRI